jgi:hypothetical protein
MHFTTGAQNHTKPEYNIFAQPPLRQTSHPLSHRGARFMRSFIAHEWHLVFSIMTNAIIAAHQLQQPAIANVEKPLRSNASGFSTVRSL